MKRSKKLLSLLLAFVMAFGLVSSVMVASAADTKKHLAYGEKVSKKNVDDLVGIVDGLVGGLVEGIEIPNFKLDLSAFAKGEYFTNANAARFAGTVYKLLADAVKGQEGIVPMVATVKPQMAFEYMTGGAKILADMRAAGIDTESMEAWDQIDYSKIDLGFEDGDKNGFIKGFTNCIGYIGVLLYMVDMMAGTPGMGVELPYILTTDKGIYHTVLIPLYQALGVSDYIAWTEFPSYDKVMNEVAEKDRVAYIAENVLAPILTPVFDVALELAAGPVDTLLGKVPNFLYSFETGKLDSAINTLIPLLGLNDVADTLKSLGIIKADGSINHDIAGALNALINSVFGQIVPGVPFGLPEMKTDWDDVMKKLGTKDAKPGAGQTGTQKVINAADSSDVFMGVFNYAMDALEMEGNQRLIKAALVVLELDEPINSMVLDLVAMERGDLLLTAMELLGVEGLPVVEDPSEPSDPSTPDGNDPVTPEIPQTGDIAISAFAMLAVAGAAGIVLTKKKHS